MVHNVNKDLGNLCLSLLAFDAGKFANCAATSFMLMAWVPKNSVLHNCVVQTLRTEVVNPIRGLYILFTFFFITFS